MAAVDAEAVQLKSMGLNYEAVFRGDLFLQSLNFTVFELHDLSAAGTNKVIVMTLVGNIIVLRL